MWLWTHWKCQRFLIHKSANGHERPKWTKKRNDLKEKRMRKSRQRKRERKKKRQTARNEMFCFNRVVRARYRVQACNHQSRTEDFSVRQLDNAVLRRMFSTNRWYADWPVDEWQQEPLEPIEAIIHGPVINLPDHNAIGDEYNGQIASHRRLNHQPKNKLLSRDYLIAAIRNAFGRRTQVIRMSTESVRS